MSPLTTIRQTIPSKVLSAASTLRLGDVVVIADGRDSQRGTAIASAWHADHEAVAFLEREAGPARLALSSERCDELDLKAMPAADFDSPAAPATSTSVRPRSRSRGFVREHSQMRSIRTVIDPAATPSDLVSPGDVYLVRGSRHGLLGSQDPVEAALELARLAGAPPAAIVAPIVLNRALPVVPGDPSLFSERHHLQMLTVSDVVDHRLESTPLVERAAEALVPTVADSFRGYGYRSTRDGAELLALVSGEVENADGVLVCVHRECVAGDALRSLRCSCRRQLDLKLEAIRRAQRGILIYLPDARDGLGPLLDHNAAPREPGVERLIVRQILSDLGVAGFHTNLSPTADSGEIG